MSLNQHVDFPARKPKCRAQCKETRPTYMVLVYSLLEITLIVYRFGLISVESM